MKVQLSGKESFRQVGRGLWCKPECSGAVSEIEGAPRIIVSHILWEDYAKGSPRKLKSQVLCLWIEILTWGYTIIVLVTRWQGKEDVLLYLLQGVLSLCRYMWLCVRIYHDYFWQLEETAREIQDQTTWLFCGLKAVHLWERKGEQRAELLGFHKQKW